MYRANLLIRWTIKTRKNYKYVAFFLASNGRYIASNTLIPFSFLKITLPGETRKNPLFWGMERWFVSMKKKRYLVVGNKPTHLYYWLIKMQDLLKYENKIRRKNTYDHRSDREVGLQR